MSKTSRLRATLLGAWVAVLLGTLLSSPAHARNAELPEGLKQIDRRGRLAVCTTMAFPLFAYYDKEQQPTGLVPDLIRDMQGRLERKLGKPLTLEIVKVTPVNRIEFLRQGRCDFMVSTLSKSAQRIDQLNFAEPGFYRSGWTVLALKTTKLTSWEELRGKQLCASPTNSWARDGERRYGIKFVTYFGGEIDSQRALLDGRCLGSVAYDTYYDVALRLQRDGTWDAFEIKLPSRDFSYWTVSARNGRPELVAWLSEQVVDWHRTGLIVNLEKKHGIKPNEWIAQMHDEYSRKTP